MYFHRGMFFTCAPATQIAMEAPRMALAPKLFLLAVPSSSIISSSSFFCSRGFLPLSALAILPLTAATAFSTPLPL